MEGKRKRKTATNHHNKQQQLAPPPYPSPKGRGVKCNESNWPHPPNPSLWGRGKGEGPLVAVVCFGCFFYFTTAPSSFLTTSLILLHSPLLYI